MPFYRRDSREQESLADTKKSAIWDLVRLGELEDMAQLGGLGAGAKRHKDVGGVLGLLSSVVESEQFLEALRVDAGDGAEDAHATVGRDRAKAAVER